MTYDEFKKKYNGKYVDFDKSYGAQCWDLGEYYFTECLKLPASVLSGCGLVSNMLKGKFRKRMDKYFTEVKTPQKGDVAIWEYGHIAVFDHKTGNDKYYFSQNPNPCKVMKINRGGVHFFRLKNANKAKYKITTANLNMRNKASLSGKILLVIPKGKKIEYTKDAGTSNGYTWSKVKYSGKTGYVASRYLK